MKENLPKALKAFSLLFTIFLANLSYAQTTRKPDVIQLREDKKLEVLIQEVDDKQVKYKKVTDPDGPVFTVLKTDIVSIQYGNGETETFEAVLSVPGYYSPGKSSEQSAATTQPAQRPTGNKFLDQIRASSSEDLRVMYKYHRSKSNAGLFIGIGGTAAGIIVAAIGTGIVVNAMDANGYYKSYQDELRARKGAWMMLGGFAGAITCSTVGFIKAGKNGSKASKIRRELMQRGETLTWTISPSFNPSQMSGGVTLGLRF